MITFIKEEAVFVMATVILILSGIGISNLNHGPEEEDPINTTATAQQTAPSLTTQSSAPAPTPAVPTQTVPAASITQSPTPTTPAPAHTTRYTQHSREGGQNESDD